MSCRECEELIAIAVRAGEPLEHVADHLARCEACREFAAQITSVSALLATWETPAPTSTAATRAALAAKLVDAQQRRQAAPGTLARLLESPVWLALLGAAALAAGVAVAPVWLQHWVMGWFAVAAVLVSLVLLHQDRRITPGGEEL